MIRVLITFGWGHAHQSGSKMLDKDCVAVIKCSSHEEGRKLAFEWFDGKFHNSYVEGEEPANLMDYFPRGKIEIN